MTRAWLPPLLVLALGACGTRYADPIRGTSGPAGDACGVWKEEAECLADTANGCSFQPNQVGCKTTDPGCAPGVCRAGDPFVRRRQDALWLHDLPYRFVGTVSWGIAWGGCEIGTLETHDEALVRTFDDMVDLGVTVLKIWAFQSYAGTSGTDYSRFERVVDAARRAGVRLIFVLENHYADCTSGSARDDAWYAGGYASPYGDYTLSFPDYAAGVASHFRDEPAILAWEIMHEAQAGSFDALNGFAGAMSTVLRANAPNHLVVLGLDNGDSSATDRSGAPSNYERLHSHPAVDLADAHDFFAAETPLPGGMAEIRALGAALGKPVFAGATAVELADTSPESFTLRAEQVEAKLGAALDAGFAGFLVYDYIPDWTLVTWSFDTRREEPLAGPNGVLARHAIESP